LSGPDAPNNHPRKQLWLLPKQGDAHAQPVAEVAVMRRSRRLYTYGIPPKFLTAISPGCWVTVPFGKSDKPIDALCVRVGKAEWRHTQKLVQAASPAPPLLTPPLLQLGLWIADYYAASFDVTYGAMAPERSRRPLAEVPTLVRTAAGHGARLTPKQGQLLSVIEQGPIARNAALQQAGVTAAVLKPLVERDLVRIEQRVDQAAILAEAGIDPDAVQPHSPEDAFALTGDQSAAINAITAAATAEQRFQPFLLFGVPGSGKTEVYVRAMRAVAAAGRQAVLVVPEIALATQIVERLARRFGRVAILHSRLTARKRAATLHAIAQGAVDVVIGTRTAVFAPFRALGLIVVDEEQETSLKSPAAPYFHARDVAVKRGQLENAPVVLGSATPSLESWYNAHERGVYQLLQLKERVPGATFPTTEIVPLADDSGRAGAGLISRTLHDALRDTLQRAKQAILLHNRRGYALNLRCSRCGTVVTCPRCAAYAVVHQGGAAKTALRCHRCGWRSEDVRQRCPDSSCDGPLERIGRAIQQIEERLKQYFPAARVLRLDSDTMRNREDYAQTLQAFDAGAADILLGTQMVAKGLDFPNVELVGVIDGDAALWLPDFRAGERVFQLLMQVVGRAGRRAGASRAIVQVNDARSAPVQAAEKLDYAFFAERELAGRKNLFYPPWSRLTRIVLSDRSPRRVRAAAEKLSAGLTGLAERIHPRIRVNPAEPCVQSRLRNLLRWQVLIRSPRDDSMQRLLREAEAARLLRSPAERLTIDVDAIDML
jgi:primosomal protein N' (replication factor Y)